LTTSDLFVTGEANRHVKVEANARRSDRKQYVTALGIHGATIQSADCINDVAVTKYFTTSPRDWSV